MIQAMICGFVPRSGAGMSLSGPISIAISVAYRRVRCSSSVADSVLGSQMTPPLAPPYGSPTTAHFQVISIASARTSSSVTSGWYRMPPFVGPSTVL